MMRPLFLPSMASMGPIDPSSKKMTRCQHKTMETKFIYIISMGVRRVSMNLILMNLALNIKSDLFSGWWFPTVFIFQSIWDVILPIDSYFSRWLLHHQPALYYHCHGPLNAIDNPSVRQGSPGPFFRAFVNTTSVHVVTRCSAKSIVVGLEKGKMSPETT